MALSCFHSTAHGFFDYRSGPILVRLGRDARHDRGFS